MHLFKVLVEEAVHDGVCTNRGHGQEVARGIDVFGFGTLRAVFIQFKDWTVSEIPEICIGDRF